MFRASIQSSRYKYKRLALALKVFFGFIFAASFFLDFEPYLPDSASVDKRQSVKRVAIGSTYFGSKVWHVGKFDTCSVNKCEYVHWNQIYQADAVIYHGWDVYYPWVLYRLLFKSHREDQIRVLYNWEPPTRFGWYPSIYNSMFHWFATYRSDADLFTPYGMLEKLSPKEKAQVKKRLAKRNFAAGRSKLGFVLTSHCTTRSGRMEFVRELKSYLGDSFDIFGSCGTPCPFDCNMQKLSEVYKFYIAYENSECRDYVTEKLWDRAIALDLVPVVFGGIKGPEDYLKFLPENSFIHVKNYPSTMHLANYLMKLHMNSTLYNQYFTWRQDYKLSVHGENQWWCQLCKRLHHQPKSSGLTYKYPLRQDFNKFWNYSNDCIVKADSSFSYKFFTYFAYFTGLAL